MTTPECIFCRIAAHEVPAAIRYEDDEIVIFDDIRPKAPTHLLVVPKRHIASVVAFEDGDRLLVGSLVLAAKRAAAAAGIGDGYKLVFNVGHKGGQLVDHVHLHLLGGWDRDQE